MTTQDGGWLTIRDASLSLGVSELTIRRRIKSGKIAYRLDGGKYFVNLAAEQPPPTAATPPPPAPPRPAAEPVLLPDKIIATELPGDSVLAEYGRLAERAGRAAALEETLRRLEEQRASLEQSLVSLAGRNGWLESRLEERERELRLLVDSSPKPGFFRRLFGRPGKGNGSPLA